MRYVVLAACAALALSACGPTNSAEKTGEKMDSAFEQATTGSTDRTDGPMEQTGEAIDQAASDASKAASDAADTARDATHRAAEDVRAATAPSSPASH